MTDSADKTIVDPENGKTVRFTDNSAKEEDFYPKNQEPSPLFLDPVGAPYEQVEELDGYILGQNEETDRQAVLDNEAWEAARILDEYMEAANANR